MLKLLYILFKYVFFTVFFFIIHWNCNDIIREKRMVKIGLQLKAFLENVSGLQAEGEDFR